MYIFRTNIALLIWVLGVAEQLQSVSITPEHIIHGEASSPPIENILSTVDHHQAISAQTLGTLKRSGEPISRGDNSKMARLENGSFGKVRKCYWRTSTRWKKWSSEFLNLGWGEEQKNQLGKKVKDVLTSINILFQKRLHELSGRQIDWNDLFERRGSYMPHDISLKLSEKWEANLLESISQISRFQDSYLLAPDKPSHISLMKKASDIMIDIFIDLQKHQIIRDTAIAHFLNKEDGELLIYHYIIGRFPLDESQYYLLKEVLPNFNLRLSLQEGPSTRKMVGILKFLEPETWCKIEMLYLQYQYQQYQQFSHSHRDFFSVNHFDQIYKEFWSFMKNVKKSINIYSEMYLRENILDKMVKFISEIKIEGIAPWNYQLWIELKLLHEMLRIMFEGTQISKDGMKSDIAYKIGTFEELFGLISSLSHLLYVREKAIEVEEKIIDSKVDFLVDRNEHRIMSIFGDNLMPETITPSEMSKKEGKFFSKFKSNIKQFTSPEVLQKLEIEFSKFTYHSKRVRIMLSTMEDKNNSSNIQYIQVMQFLTIYMMEILAEYHGL